MNILKKKGSCGEGPNYLGCYMEGNPRDLPYEPALTSLASIEVCLAACSAANYSYYGLQYS